MAEIEARRKTQYQFPEVGHQVLLHGGRSGGSGASGPTGGRSGGSEVSGPI